MAQESANMVISGKFKGNTIYRAASENLAYINYNGQRHYITKKDIESIEHIRTTDTTNAVDVLYGTVIAGAAGAVAAKTPHNLTLLKVCWCDGSTSIFRVTDPMYETVIVGMNDDIADDALNQVETNDQAKIAHDKQEDFNFKILFWVVIAAIWFFLEMYGNS